jgi:hypothetical protein
MTDAGDTAGDPAGSALAPAAGRWSSGMRLWWERPLTPLFIFLFLLAGYSTWEGLTSYITSTSGDIDPRALIFVTLFTVALIVMMGITLQGVAHGEGWIKRLGWFVAYLPLFLMSMCFAFAFWWTLMISESATNENVDRDYQRSINALTDVQARLDLAGNRLNTVAGAFRTSAEAEERRGNSCGVASGSTRGPLTILREQQAQKFGGMAGQLKLLAGEVEARVQGVKTATAPLVESSRAASVSGEERAKILETVREQLTRIATDVNGRLASLPNDARALEADASNHSRRDGFIDPNTGQPMTCFDPNARLLSSAAESLRAVGQVPDITFQVYQEAAATVEAITRFLNEFGLGALIGASGDAGLDRRDTIPFAMALVVDVGLLLIGLRRGQGASLGPLERARRREEQRRLGRDASTLTPTELARERARLTAMFARSFDGAFDELLVNRRGWTFVVVPTEIQGPRRRRASALLRFLETFPRRRSPVFEITHWNLLRRQHDRSAQRLLAARSGESPTGELQAQALDDHRERSSGVDWASASGFRWFRIDWRRAHQLSEALQAWEDEALAHGELVGEADDAAMAQARANRAQARRERVRTTFEAHEAQARARAELLRVQAEVAGGDLRFQTEQEGRRLRELARRQAEAEAQERSEQAEHEGSLAHLEALAAVVAERTAADSEAVLARLRKEAEAIRNRARQTEESDAAPADDESFHPRANSRLSRFVDELADRFRRRRG